MSIEFGMDEAMGQSLLVKGRPHTVIGVVKNTTTPINLSGINLDTAAFVSLEDGMSFYQGIAQIQQLVISVNDVARIPEVAEAIAALDGVSEVYSVTGQIDLIALVRVREHEDVASVVADRLNKVEGVTETETHIAFRTYSKHDLESAFSIGLD